LIAPAPSGVSVRNAAVPDARTMLANMRKFEAPRGTSTDRANETGLRSLNRSAVAMRPHGPRSARRAASTARSTSTAAPRLARPNTSAVAGYTSGSQSPPSLSVDCPSIW